MIPLKRGIFLVLALVLQSSLCNAQKPIAQGKHPFKIPRVAIIGGGIGGAATAYELSLRKVHYKMDLFEEAEIGGRLATVEINGNHFETGGSIIHKRNHHMVRYVENNDLHWNDEPSENWKSDKLGLYDGEEFVFVSSDMLEWDLLRMVWRYGRDGARYEETHIMPMLDAFERIYDAQQEGTYFANVHHLLDHMTPVFSHFMKQELKDSFLANGYSKVFIDEIVFVATNVNYNQNTSIHQFAGCMSLALSQPGSLRSVEGGNKLVPEALIKNSDANIIKARVDSITLIKNRSFALAVENTSYIYDYVVIACPIIEGSINNIKLVGFPDLKIPSIKYTKTVTTLVHGELNHTFFHYYLYEELPDEIYSVNEKLFFNSISVVSPVKFDPNYDRKVFKVFSKDVLTDEQLNLLFRFRNSVKVVPWLAYPSYDTKDRHLPFELYDNLFYVNSIEWAASAMEMSAISAVNIARQLAKRLYSWDVV